MLTHRELNEATDGELDFYSYSGRAMYGARCVAIDGDNVLDAVAKIVEAWKDATYELAQLLRRARYDNMGMGMVLYFPEIEWDPEVAGSEEDENEDT